MLYIIFGGLCLLLLMGGSSQRNRRLAATARHLLLPLPATGHPAVSVSSDGWAAEIDSLFADYFAGGATAPGCAYGVVVDGEVVHTGGLGTLRVGEDATPGPDSIFRIASMSKSFVAAAVMLLRDEGVLQLDDPVEKWVPQLKGLPLATLDSRPPTLRQLMSMSSGLPEDDPWADRLELLPQDDYTALIAEGKTFGRSPGVAYEYSNLGFTLLGRVIGNATGRPTLQFIQERLITPLGMKDTHWSNLELDAIAEARRLALGYHRIEGEWVAQPIQQPGAFSALGGLYSTVRMESWPP
eukprot:COSAG05_NODE_2387_length_3132_cov_1.598088_5_plen_297_part_00